MMNKLHVGVERQVGRPLGAHLLIDDQAQEYATARARFFQPGEDSFNALHGMDHRKARDLAAILYTLSPQGENTLTVRNGKRALAGLLLRSKRLDALPAPTDEAEKEAAAVVEDVLFAPIVRETLCGVGALKGEKICARVDRGELGEFDALALGLILIANYKGQIVVPDFGFYGRDVHTALVREERLICGVNFLAELPPKLRAAVLLMKEKTGSRTTFEDAETLATYAGWGPADHGYREFVQELMGR